MSQIAAFPASRTTPAAGSAPAAANGLAAEVHRLIPGPAAAGRSAGAAGDDATSLHELVAKMRRDAEDLSRSMAELQSAVRALTEADLPAQARALVAEALGDADRSRAR